VYGAKAPPANVFRFRISPDVVIALSAQVLCDGEEMKGKTQELLATECHDHGRMGDYERLLTDAMRGDAMLFARQDAVEQSWRIVDAVLSPSQATEIYEAGTWGPAKAAALAADYGGWMNPVMQK
jgi:glucose-6-phosphate 1-dehydrogenase